MATASAIGIATGGGGAVTGAMQGLSASGSYMIDAKDRGMNEKQCKLYGAIMGTIEGATGALTFGNSKVAGKTIGELLKGGGVQGAKNIAKQTTREIAKKEALRTGGKALFINAMEEGFQEGITEPIQELTAGWIGGQDKANWENMPSRILESAAAGAFSSVIVGGGNIGVNSCIDINTKISNGETVTQQELVKAYKDASKKLDTKKIMDDTVKQYQTIIQNQNAEQQNQSQNQNTINTQQITQTPNNLSQNQTSEQIGATKTLQTDNINQNISSNKNLYNETANKYNIDTNNNTVKSIQEVTEKRGIQARYDADIFNNSNEEAMWTQKEDGSREIVINPLADSNKILQNIVVHELFHDFEGTQEKKILINMALEKMKTQEGYEKAMKSLADTYAQKYDRNSADFNQLVEEEAAAKFLGENLGNQEFVNELIAKQDRNAVQRVYDWVVDKVESLKNRITGDTEAEYWRKVKNNFEKAFSKQYQGNKSNVTTKYDVIYNKDGSFDRVKIKDNIFKNTNNKSISRTIYDYLTEHINEYADIIESGQRVYLGKDLPGEYTYSKSAQSLSLPQKMAKGRAITELKEIINNATNREYSNYKKQKHVNDAKYGFYKYDTKFSFEQNGKEQTYTGTILIRNDANGKKYLYDILDIKKIGSNLPPVASNSQKSSAKNGGSNFLPTNSITSNKNDVNTTTKYSMQESENNSDSFSFDNKRFDVTGNENLYKSGTLFFRTRPDGIYYVQATDHSGSLIYEGTFLDKKSLSKTLGEDIAEYIVNNSEETNNEIYIDNQGNQPKDYKMYHRPSEEYGNASDFEHNMDGVFEHPQWYMDMNQAYNIESLEALRNVRNNPNAEITIYRATPGDNINYGDWVTPSKKYAELHNNSQLNGKGNILKLKVKAKDILWGGDDINEFGYFPDNNKYSQNTTFDNFVKQNSINKGTGETLEQVKLPPKKDKLPKMKDIVSKGEMVNFSEMERPSGKIRKHYKSIIESSNTTPEAKAIAKKMMGTDTYIPDSNNNQLERANRRIENSTPDAELQSLMSRSTIGDKITATDIAVGEKLIQYYSLIGDKAKLQDAIQATAMAGTTAGQTVQAMSLLNHQTPEGQAIWIQRSVEKMNETLKKNRGENAEQFNLTPDMLNKIVNSKDEQQLQQNVNEVYEELGQQVSKSTIEKIDSWRYFSMLANPRTHIRNIVGNFAMGQTQQVKNKVAGVIEGLASKINPNIERTHTIVPASAEVKEFAKNDILNVADRLGLSENKYNPQTRLQNSMRTFKSDVMENTVGKLFSLNDNALEAEDGWGLKAGYKKALSEYMTANKLTPDNITDAQLGKARNYAVQQAKEATFHQECQLASLVNQLSNKNKFAKYTTDAILPFVKTPMNVAKAGMEYSPVGLAKSMVLDTSRLRKGDINVNQYIDNISKGLTGTGIALVGYALAQCGILKASGDEDDKKEKYDENQGKQTYSIQIGDNTYSLDWLAPTGIPLFIGAEISEMSKAKAEEKTSLSSDSESKYSQTLESGTNLLNAMANSMNPMTEMSMLSGLTSALSSYEQGSAQMLASIGTNSVKSYVNQFVPTALGQIAKTTDEYERSTTSTKTGILPKTIDSTKNQIMSKIPGLRQKLPTKTDVWGNDLKQNEGQDTVTQVLDKTISDTGRKFIENAIFPWTRKKISSNNVDKELTDLYDSTGESSVLPSTLDKTLTIDGQKYRMTSNEYANYKKQYGKTAFTIFSNIIKTNDYKNLSEGSRKEVIEDIYSYSKELLKKDYAEKNSLEYTPSTMMKTINSIEDSGGNANTYFKYQGAVSQLKAQKVSSGELEEGQNIKDTDKMQLLVNSNYSNKEKSAIFENCILNSNENNFYTIALKDSTININEYLQYKIKESNEEFTSDKDKYGNSISGTSKKKYYNYINNNITGYNNKLLLLAQKYKLSNNERQDLTEYINKKYKGQDRIDVFKKLSTNYKVTADNKVYYK